MDLLEYQAKELFQQVGIPILPSQPLNNPSEIKRLNLPYPIVLKSQVRIGGRGKAGGIRFVENTIDAIAAARTIFNLSIAGEYPQVVLAEARYDAQEEFFLAIVLDYQLQRPVLMGSAKGGIDIDTLLEHLQKVVIEDDFSPFYARRLAMKMGLGGELIQSVSGIIEKMYTLFSEKDLDLIEINPLGVSAQGKVMALDGKITVNDAAIGRHPDLISLMDTQKALPVVPCQTIAPLGTLKEPQWLKGWEDKGNIAILSNSVGLALATWDLLSIDGGKVAGGFIVDDTQSQTAIAQQINYALMQASQMPHLKAMLINWLGSPATTVILTQTLENYLQPILQKVVQQKSEDRTMRPTGPTNSPRKRRPSPAVSPKFTNGILPLVIRLVGVEIENLKENLSLLPLYWTDNLEAAISETLK